MWVGRAWLKEKLQQTCYKGYPQEYSRKGSINDTCGVTWVFIYVFLEKHQVSPGTPMDTCAQERGPGSEYFEEMALKGKEGKRIKHYLKHYF